MSVIVEETPNNGPPIEEMWAFVSRDKEGRENTVGGFLPGMGMTPLVTGNPKTLKLFVQLAKLMKQHLDAEGSTQTVHFLRFSHREELPWPE